MHIITLQDQEIFRGQDALACLSHIAAQQPKMTVAEFCALGYRITPWRCPGHSIENGVCTKCGFVSAPF